MARTYEFREGILGQPPRMDVLLLVAAGADRIIGGRLVARSPWADRRRTRGALPLVQATDARLSARFVLPNIVDNLGPTPATGHFAVWEHLLLEFAAGLAGVDSRRSPPIQTLAQRPCR